MLLHLSDQSSESLQQQIVRQIRALILSAEIEAGADMPSIRLLSRTQRVSVITVQRAYELLVREGLIHARRGKGFFVSDIPDYNRQGMAREQLSENLRPLIQRAMDEGLSVGDIRSAIKETLQSLSEQKKER
jgi:GntR family transcriptional regulator